MVILFLVSFCFPFRFSLCFFPKWVTPLGCFPFRFFSLQAFHFGLFLFSFFFLFVFFPSGFSPLSKHVYNMVVFKLLQKHPEASPTDALRQAALRLLYLWLVGSGCQAQALRSRRRLTGSGCQAQAHYTQAPALRITGTGS